MKVSDLMTHDVAVCHPGDSMARAAQLMWDGDLGCIPITDEERRIQGILTDRDIAMAAFTKGRALQALPVEEAMSKNVRCCKSADKLEVALDSMSEELVRRLVVVDDKNRVVGLLSLADALQATAGSKSKAGQQLADRALETMTRITRPRTAQITIVPTKATVATKAKPTAKKAATKKPAQGKAAKAKSPRKTKS